MVALSSVGFPQCLKGMVATHEFNFIHSTDISKSAGAVTENMVIRDCLSYLT